MSYLKISIEGLKEFKQLLAKNPSLEKTVPDMTLGILQIQNIIEKRQKELYNAPGSVSSVFLGKSVKPASLGKTFLTYGLQYKDVPIPLQKYPTNIVKSSVTSKAPLRIGGKDTLTRVKWKKGKWSKEVWVKIRKDKKEKIARRGTSGYKGFFGQGALMARKQKATWSVFPTKGKKGTRAKTSLLFGPSLATLAISIANKDSVVKNAIENILPEVLMKSMAKQYD